MANSFGTLYAEVILRNLIGGVFKTFPMLNQFSTDFSNEQAKFGAEINSRIVTVPTVADYSTTTNGDGYNLNKGNATTTDVPVVLNQFKHVTFEFTDKEIASTGRNLLTEQIEAAAYALGRNLVDAVYAIMTPTNFPAATNETVETAANTDAQTMNAVRTALRKRGCRGQLFSILNADAFGALTNDNAVTSLDFVRDFPDYDGQIVRGVRGVREVIEDANLPSANSLVGFAGAKDALVVATRVPNDAVDLAREMGIPVPADIRVVTDEATGASMQYRMAYEPRNGKLQLTLAWMYGVAKGAVNNGQLIVSTSNVST